MPYVPDISGRGPSTATLAGRGLIALVVLVLLAAGLLLRYQGAFQPVFPATALVDDIGDGLRPGADVKLRGALVGRVDGVQVRPSAAGPTVHEVSLRLRPDLAAEIPAGVTARVVPTNVFGAPSLELLDSGVTAARLERDAVIPGDRSAGTLQLQTVLNQLNTVLRAVRPADLNVALTSISEALRGRGAKLGSIIGRSDGYLGTLNAHRDEFTTDLALLGTDLRTLAEIAPELLDTVDNAVVTSRTLVEERAKLADTLTGARLTADRADGFLSDVDDRVVRLADDGSGVARVLAGQRELIPGSLRSLSAGTAKLGEGFRQDKGGLSIMFTLSPFAPYTGADCPRYGAPGTAAGSAAGPNCAGGGR